MKAIFVLFALVAIAAAGIAPLRTLERDSKSIRAQRTASPCDGNPCGSGETCCIIGGSQAGCCPAANACCCPDQAHCCTNGLQCVCQGTCPGPNCNCGGCAQSGQCQNSASQIAF